MTDGHIEILDLQPPAEVPVHPGFVYTFTGIDASLVEVKVGGENDKDLIIVLPGDLGEITLLDFPEVQAGKQPATLRWLQGNYTTELQIVGLNGFAWGENAVRSAPNGLRENGADGDLYDRKGGSLLPAPEPAAALAPFGMFPFSNGSVSQS